MSNTRTQARIRRENDECSGVGFAWSCEGPEEGHVTQTASAWRKMEAQGAEEVVASTMSGAVRIHADWLGERASR